MNSIPSFLTSIFYHNSNFYKKFLHLMLLIFAAGISVFAFAPFYHFTALIISLSGIIFYIEAKNFKLKYYYTYFSVFYIVQLYWMFYSLHTIIKLNILIAVVCFSLMILYLVIYMHFMLFLYNKLKFIDKDHKKPYARIYNLLILLPSIWVLIEYLRGILFTGFPWCNLAYSVVSNRFFNGLFPLFGSYAVSFLIVSFIAYIVLCCTYITEYFIHKKLQLSLRVFKILSIISIIYIIIFMILAYYLYHKQYTKISSHPTTVALVQGNISLESKWHSQEYLSIYTNMLTQIPKNSSDIIVLPETAIASFEENLPNNYLDNLANMAIMLGANLVTGIPKFLTNNNNNTMYDNTTYVNTAMLLTDKNHPYYAKVHLVPYGEYIPLKFILKPFYKFINLTDRLVRDITLVLKELRVLELGCCWNITDNALYYLGVNLDLEYLSLEKCYGVTDAGLGNIVGVDAIDGRIRKKGKS